MTTQNAPNLCDLPLTKYYSYTYRGASQASDRRQEKLFTQIYLKVGAIRTSAFTLARTQPLHASVTV